MSYGRYKYRSFDEGDDRRPQSQTQDTGNQRPHRSIKEVTRVPKNKSLFRSVARDASGENFDAPEEDRLVFLYERSEKEGEKLVGAISFHLANNSINEQKDEGYYHSITYLFIRPDHQKQGHGRALLRYVENIMLKACRRNIHVQSAGPAMRFFEKNGYVRQGDAMECVCSGSSRFSRLYDMVKVVGEARGRGRGRGRGWRGGSGYSWRGSGVKS